MAKHDPVQPKQAQAKQACETAPTDTCRRMMRYEPKPARHMVRNEPKLHRRSRNPTNPQRPTSKRGLGTEAQGTPRTPQGLKRSRMLLYVVVCSVCCGAVRCGARHSCALRSRGGPWQPMCDASHAAWVAPILNLQCSHSYWWFWFDVVVHVVCCCVVLLLCIRV